jgi:hypothetical protein
VSVGTSGGPAVPARGATPRIPGTASWTGLLLDGCERVEQVAADGLPQGWARKVREQIGSGDLGWMLGAAEDITDRLGGRSGGEYRRWLADSVGSLRVRDPSVIGSLAALDVPLATTNYDGLIEEVTCWPPVTWRDGARVQDAGEVALDRSDHDAARAHYEEA